MSEIVKVRGHSEPTGQLEGETCGRVTESGSVCHGTIEEDPVENCSCHINPPCGAHSTPREYCPECGWRAENDEVVFNDHLVRPANPSGAWSSWRPRPLDRTKIDWRSKSHTHFSMIKEGCFPPGASQEEVRRAVDGTFGGRFKRFDEDRCEFEFIAYTD